MAEDIRKTYILSTTANFFSKDVNDFQKFAYDKNLTKFLDDLNVLALIVNANREITFTTRVKNLKKIIFLI